MTTDIGVRMGFEILLIVCGVVGVSSGGYFQGIMGIGMVKLRGCGEY